MKYKSYNVFTGMVTVSDRGAPFGDCSHALGKDAEIVQKNKKQRLHEKNRKCMHYFAKKKRYCGMQRRNGYLFCGLHLEEQQEDGLERVQCPYGNHTVWKKVLNKHVKTCPEFLLQKKLESESYYEPGVNRNQTRKSVELPRGSGFLGNQKDSVSNRRLAAIIRMGEAKLLELVDKIDSLWTRLGCNDICRAPDQGRVSEPERHYVQQASIYEHMKRLKFFKEHSSTTYIEFGSGKGYLTRSLVELVSPHKLYRVILVDRKTFKTKADKFLRESNVTRIRCDISHFNPSKIEGMSEKSNILVYGKHLCGSATDYSIRCVKRQLEKKSTRPVGFAIASCCHYLTSWDQYVGSSILENLGMSPEEFEIMCYMSGWSTCGCHHVADHGRCQQDDDEIDVASVDVWKPHRTISRNRRVEIGNKCKDLIDRGRILYFLSLAGVTVGKIVYYVDPVISIENRLLLGAINTV